LENIESLGFSIVFDFITVEEEQELMKNIKSGTIKKLKTEII